MSILIEKFKDCIGICDLGHNELLPADYYERLQSLAKNCEDYQGYEIFKTWNDAIIADTRVLDMTFLHWLNQVVRNGGAFIYYRIYVRQNSDARWKAITPDGITTNRLIYASFWNDYQQASKALEIVKQYYSHAKIKAVRA